MKKIILPILFLALVLLCSFQNKNESKISPDTKDVIETFDYSFKNGNKSWDEVRIVRRKVIVKIFTDVITKYKEDIPDEPEEIVALDLSCRIQKIINKYKS